MFASTGDAAHSKQRVDYIVDELRECQAARGDGLVCAFPDGAAQLENAVAGRPFVGVPWYTMHKIFAGLARRAPPRAAARRRSTSLTKLADWTCQATRGMTDEQFQRMLGTEHGGMNEVLADVCGAHRRAEVPRPGAALQPPRRCSSRSPKARDTLDGLHANTQIPKVDRLPARCSS